MKNTPIVAFGDCIESGTYTFHSGFESIDNFVNLNGEFISLAADISFLAPNSIIINDFISTKYSCICIDDEFIHFNNIKLILNKELRYHSIFKYPEIAYSVLESKILAFINLYASDFPLKSLFFLLHPENKKYFTSAFEKAFVKQMEYAFSLFHVQLYESIEEFKSRGNGLTPSGDDFIAGVLFGIDLVETLHNKDYVRIKDTIYKISKSNNLFSNNMLRMAYHARYFKRLQDFLNAFFYLPLTDLRPAFEQLIAVGDTSGADMLTGFFTVILFNAEVSKEDAKHRWEIVEDKVVIEVKSIEALNDIHTAQVLTYLKLSGCKLGLLMNFNVLRLVDGLKRLVNKL